jgi:cytochrome b
MIKMKPNESVESFYVWDCFIRVFHWSLVSCVLLDYFVIDDGETLHQWFGYAACLLVLARIVWGFVGSKYARFSDFFPTPTRIIKHLRHMIYGEQDMHLGHNPLGAMMMFALITLVLALGVTGFMQSLDAYWGVEWLMDLHNTLANILIALAVMHVIAAMAMSFIERTNLIKAMITGVKVFHSTAKSETTTE